MTKQKIVTWVFSFCLLAYFLGLVLARAPAIWAAWIIQQSLPNAYVSSVSGTLWSGKARAAQVSLGREAIPLGELSWHLRPLSLLLLSPCVQFETRLSGQLLSGEFCRSPLGNNRIKALKVEAPVSVIKELLPLPVNGAISLQVLSAEFDAQANVKQLDARFSWEAARVQIDDAWQNLGSVAAKVKEDGQGGVAAEIFDLDGPFKLDLNGTWRARQAWKFQGTVKPQDNAAPMLVEGLKILGEQRDNGEYFVEFP